MDLRTILEKFTDGQLGLDEIQRQISIDSIENVHHNFARLDIGREIRKGVPEIIFAEGKEYNDLIKIVNAVVKRKGFVVVSRVKAAEISKLCKALKKRNLYVEIGRKSTTILVSTRLYSFKTNGSKIGILSAGTSDIGIAEEARLVAKAMGCLAILYYDVGIAGIHRLFPALQEMVSAQVDAIVVVAGMEGALASVVSSMVDIPVIGVPTSVGYGFGSAGIASLACMLQSCTFGVAVVNIDNGIGAGAFAALISNRTTRRRKFKNCARAGLYEKLDKKSR